MGTAQSVPPLEKFGMPDAAPPGAPSNGKRRVSWWVPIRTLRPRHRRQILDHLVQLNDDDRYMRFGSHASLEYLTRYTAAIDFQRDEVFGIFNSRLQLVAMAHLAGLPPGSSPAGPQVSAMEFGVSVLPQARGRGLGQRLFEHAVTHARNHHAGALVIHALTENRPMIRIALRAGAKIETEGNDTDAWLRLPKDTLATHVEESLLALNGDVAYGLKRHAWRWRNWWAKLGWLW